MSSPFFSFRNFTSNITIDNLPFVSQVPLSKNDIIKCNEALRPFNIEKMCFRFPYLVEGNSKEKFDSIYLLNAYWVNELIKLFKELNFVFSTVATVLNEKEYQRLPVFTGNAGLTHFEKLHFKQ